MDDVKETSTQLVAQQEGNLPSTETLDTNDSKILSDLVQAPSKTELEKQFELFNINQSKKNALRIVKLDQLLNKVEEQAIERFSRRPDQISNKELLDFMSVVSGQIERAQKSIESTLSDDVSTLQVNAQKNEVNIKIDKDLDRDGKERVMSAVNALLQQAKQKAMSSDQEVIETTLVEEERNNDEDESTI